MKMKRLFIAINLPKNIKNRIDAVVAELEEKEKNIRFLPSDNWHLTVSFLGDQPDEAIPGILDALKKTVKKYSDIFTDEDFKIEFDEFVYGPSNKPPRMIWLKGTEETSQRIGELKKDLENNLFANNVRFESENRKYSSHITLARFREGEINKISNHSIAQAQFSFFVKSLDLIESFLSRNGAEYDILQEVDFE